MLGRAADGEAAPGPPRGGFMKKRSEVARSHAAAVTMSGRQSLPPRGDRSASPARYPAGRPPRHRPSTVSGTVPSDAPPHLCRWSRPRRTGEATSRSRGRACCSSPAPRRRAGRPRRSTAPRGLRASTSSRGVLRAAHRQRVMKASTPMGRFPAARGDELRLRAPAPRRRNRRRPARRSPPPRARRARPGSPRSGRRVRPPPDTAGRRRARWPPPRPGRIDHHRLHRTASFVPVHCASVRILLSTAIGHNRPSVDRAADWQCHQPRRPPGDARKHRRRRRRVAWAVEAGALVDHGRGLRATRMARKPRSPGRMQDVAALADDGDQAATHPRR